MTVLGIRYLTGHAVAAQVAMPRSPEYPPHFGRVFMAMAAAYFETQGSADERTALEWLEHLDAPTIRAGEGRIRSFVETYVPVNDSHGGITRRSRQARSFPTVALDDPAVYLIWREYIPEELRQPLEAVCSKVTRIGHSSSLVQMWVADEEGLGTFEGGQWEPSDDAQEQTMRVTETGTLAYLERAFRAEEAEEFQQLATSLSSATGKQKATLQKEMSFRFPQGRPEPARPMLTRWQGYVRTVQEEEAEQIFEGPFDPKLIVFVKKEEQRNFDLPATAPLTKALRDAAMSALGNDVPEWLSGHKEDGTPLARIHAAFLPLPFVGAKYADGHLMGMAIALPRDVGTGVSNRDEELRRTLGPLLFEKNGDERVVKLWKNDDWDWYVEREKRERPPITLRISTWTGPAKEWASVTPIVLHHHPKQSREGDVERILLESFARAGLPEPVALRTQSVSWFEGAGHARQMPEFREGGDSQCRFQIHAIVRFPVQVRGPVLVGRGRFRGYGLMRPTREEKLHG